ncbi:hypothetical protein CO611_01280 [Lysobacteraceae bacterium NML03-0222]|nr:hypothetical protein CO611_01280 [Xanthomonadaceae bacterium NML03-0222]
MPSKNEMKGDFFMPIQLLQARAFAVAGSLMCLTNAYFINENCYLYHWKPAVNPTHTNSQLRPLARLIPLLMFGCASPLAMAQQPQAPQRDTPQSAETLDVIEVHGQAESYAPPASSAATGLEMSLKDTPQSVTVITQQRLRDQQIQTIHEGLQQVSGLTIQNYDDNRSDIVARGFKVENYRLDGNLLVSDNTPPSLNLSAMYQRIEVTKGATGLLSGTGDPSATVNLVRKRADSSEFSAELAANLGSWKSRGFTLDMANALNADGSVRGRMVMAQQRGESFADLKDERLYSLYGIVEADLGSATRLSLGLAHDDKRITGASWGALPLFFSDGSRTYWPRSQTTATRWSYWDTRQTNAFVELAHSFASGAQWHNALNYTRRYEQSNLFWITGALDRQTGQGLQGEPYLWKQTPDNLDFTTRLSLPFQMLGFSQQASIGLHYNRFKGGWLGGGAGPHLLNADESNGDVIGNFFNWDHNSPAPIWGKLPTGSIFTTTQKAISFASRLQLAEPLKLILGGRYTHWQQDNEQADWTPQAYTLRAKEFVPYLGVVYDLTPNLAAYASYTSMFKPQENKDRHGRYLDPVRGNSQEIGLKSSWLDERLFATLALYQTRQDNFAAPDEGHFVPGTTDVASRAVKGAKVRGYELEVNGSPLPHWNISAGWSQYSAKAPDGSHLSVNQPRRSFKLFSTYTFAERLPGLKLGGGLNWYSRPPAEVENPGTGRMEAVGQPAYAVVDLMARYQVNPRLGLQLNIDNALDKHYYTQGSWQLENLVYGAPRSFRLSLDYRFH